MRITKKKLSEAAKMLGHLGGTATARSLTPEQRKASGVHAVTARWAAVRARNGEASRTRTA